MYIDEALTAYLLSQSGLTALIDRRFYFDTLPQGCTYPAVVCIDVSDVKLHTLSGQDSLESPNKQFTAYAKSRTEAKAVAAQLKDALSDYRGTMSGIEVQYIKLINELSSVEQNTDGTFRVNYVDLEYEINYTKE